LVKVAHWAGSLLGRVVRAWRILPSERRLAAIAAVGLFVTLFLPWYQETVVASGQKNLQTASTSLTGWGAFSFVEAAVLLVAVGVLVLLIQRAEGRAFHVPGGDGFVVMAAGGWTCVLIVWRIFDKQGSSNHGAFATASGIEWGIFVSLAVAALLTYSGNLIRAAHQPEPPLPGERARTRDRSAPGGPTASRDRPASGDVSPRRDDQTMVMGAPATPAGRRSLPPDEQLTMPLEGDEPQR
jgi:hypothetical protein